MRALGGTACDDQTLYWRINPRTPLSYSFQPGYGINAPLAGHYQGWKPCCHHLKLTETPINFLLGGLSSSGSGHSWAGFAIYVLFLRAIPPFLGLLSQSRSLA